MALAKLTTTGFEYGPATVDRISENNGNYQIKVSTKKDWLWIDVDDDGRITVKLQTLNK